MKLLEAKIVDGYPLVIIMAMDKYPFMEISSGMSQLATGHNGLPKATSHIVPLYSLWSPVEPPCGLPLQSCKPPLKVPLNHHLWSHLNPVKVSLKSHWVMMKPHVPHDLTSLLRNCCILLCWRPASCLSRPKRQTCWRSGSKKCGRRHWDHHGKRWFFHHQQLFQKPKLRFKHV